MRLRQGLAFFVGVNVPQRYIETNRKPLRNLRFMTRYLEGQHSEHQLMYYGRENLLYVLATSDSSPCSSVILNASMWPHVNVQTSECIAEGSKHNWQITEFPTSPPSSSLQSNRNQKLSIYVDNGMMFLTCGTMREFLCSKPGSIYR